jgi:hypothetical protein
MGQPTILNLSMLTYAASNTTHLVAAGCYAKHTLRGDFLRNKNIRNRYPPGAICPAWHANLDGPSIGTQAMLDTNTGTLTIAPGAQ